LLRVKIHRHGSRYRAAELIKHVTGALPDPQPLVKMLQTKYKRLYKI
jgi:Zn-dependent M32 family carboxypeptidase